MHASNCLIEAKPRKRARTVDTPQLQADVLARIEPGLGIMLPHASSARVADLRRLAKRYNALAAGRVTRQITGTLRLVR